MDAKIDMCRIHLLNRSVKECGTHMVGQIIIIIGTVKMQKGNETFSALWCPEFVFTAIIAFKNDYYTTFEYGALSNRCNIK